MILQFIQNRLIFAAYYDSFILLCFLLLDATIYHRFTIKRTNALLTLFGAVLSLSLGVMCAFLSRVLQFYELVYTTYGYFEIEQIGICFILLSDLFFLAFILEIFYKGINEGKNKLILIGVGIFIIAFIIYILSNFLFVQDFDKLVFLIIVLISFTIYFIIIRNAFSLARRVTSSKQDIIALKMIGSAPIFGLLTFIMLLLNVVMGSNFQLPYFFAWPFAFIFAFLVYVGYLKPKWFQDRFSEKEPKEKTEEIKP